MTISASSERVELLVTIGDVAALEDRLMDGPARGRASCAQLTFDDERGQPHDTVAWAHAVSDHIAGSQPGATD